MKEKNMSITVFPGHQSPDQSPAETAQEWVSYLEGRNLINGCLTTTKATLPVLNPATLEIIGHAAASDADVVAEAVAVAKEKQTAWADMSARKRGALVAEAGRLMASHAETLSILLAMESGKALRTECRGELTVASDLAVFYGGLGSELKGETVPFDPSVFTTTMIEPLGVVGAIVPWNVPLVLMLLKIAPALVAGNSVVVKASEEVPYATLAAGVILNSVLPDGLVNIICGTGLDCGAPLCQHDDVTKIPFTGSEAVGQAVYEEAAKRIIPASLELGGKSPMIVCADADLEKAINGAVAGMRFTRQGQSCTAASRIYVHETLLDKFVEGVKAQLNAYVIGDPLDEKTDIGTIVNKKQVATIQKYIKIAEDTEGAEVVRCSALPDADHLASDLFLQPTLILGVPQDSPVVQEEIFGPVTCIMAWSDYEDVIEAANDTHYGLAASIWTNDLKKAFNATKRLNSGYVQVNQNLTIQPNLSYGGFGRSGLGKEASLEAMIEHFTRKKTIAFSMV